MDLDTGLKVATKCKPGRKPSGPRPRSIATLSAAGIARKRATDRAAQRAQRQKTRDRIEGLEARVRELSVDAVDDWVFEAAERRNLELEQELRQLRAVQKVLLAARESASADNNMLIRTNSPTPLKVPRDKAANVSMLRPKLLSTIPQLKDSIPSFMQQPCPHVWEIPLAIKKPANPAENILWGLVHHQRTLSSTGATGTELAGPRIPSLSALLAVECSRPVPVVNRVISDLLRRISYRSVIDKLGAFLLMYPVYQWLIMQSYETYRNIPSWLIPVLSQRTTSHPIWISALGPPKLRDRIIANQDMYHTEDFQFSFVANLNANWPHGIEAALIWKDGDVTATKEFVDHAMNLDNWTIDEPFQSKYPELRDFFSFTEYPEKGAGRGNIPEAIPSEDDGQHPAPSLHQ